jgi:hypothetical protein
LVTTALSYQISSSTILDKIVDEWKLSFVG